MLITIVAIIIIIIYYSFILFCFVTENEFFTFLEFFKSIALQLILCLFFINHKVFLFYTPYICFLMNL